MITKLKITDKNWVYQSNKLIEASYTLTVTEQKLIRLLASMITKDDDDFKEYEFNTKDLIKILNTTSSRFYRDIDSITDLLMQRIIKIKDINTGEFEKYHWVDVCKYKSGVLKLKINKDLKPFYLNLDWYTKYQLKNIMQFKSTYSFRLYELCKQYENVGTRIISIDELRTILDINKTQYPKYANLKQKVISRSIKEVSKLTDLHIELEEIKTCRKITAIKFYIKQNPNHNKKVQDELAITLDENFNDLQLIKQVQHIFYKHSISEFEASCILKDSNNNLELIKNCYDYVLTKNIKNVIGYMRRLLINFVNPQANIKRNTFNNFEQREYDFEDLEKNLLGWD